MYENQTHDAAASKALLNTSHLHAKGLLNTRRYKQAALSLHKGGLDAIFNVKPMVYPSGAILAAQLTLVRIVLF